LIFLDHATTGDGLVGALQVLALMTETGKPLSELCESAMQRVPQVLVNVGFSRRIPLEQLPKTQRLIQAVEGKLGNSGRVFVRWSGTESKLRIMVEGAEQTMIQNMADEIAACARDEIAI
jgi:phosphoglucosamine mutase